MGELPLPLPHPQCSRLFPGGESSYSVDVQPIQLVSKLGGIIVRIVGKLRICQVEVEPAHISTGTETRIAAKVEVRVAVAVIVRYGRAEEIPGPGQVGKVGPFNESAGHSGVYLVICK